MYIIFCENTGILQLGAGDLARSSILNGIILNHYLPKSDILNKHLDEDNPLKFYSDKINDYFIATWKFTKSDKYQSQDCVFRHLDFRKKITNSAFKKIICFFFINIEFFIKYLKKTKTIFFILLLPFAIYSTFHFKSFDSKKSFNTNSNPANHASTDQDKIPTPDLKKWLKIFNDSKLSNKIYQSKHTYYFGKIPKIKGISEFNVIPLSNTNSDNEYSGYLLIPINKIITFRSEKDIFYINPIKTCTNKSNDTFYVFSIQSQDKALIVLNDYKNAEEKNQHVFKQFFYLFPKNPSTAIEENGNSNDLCLSIQRESLNIY